MLPALSAGLDSAAVWDTPIETTHGIAVMMRRTLTPDLGAEVAQHANPIVGPGRQCPSPTHPHGPVLGGLTPWTFIPSS